MENEDLIDWDGIKEEAADILSRYIRIKTVNPPGDEEEAVLFLSEILKRENLPHEILASAPKRANIISRIKGDDPKGLILLSHIDVVPAQSEAWDFDPFGGQREKGYIHGRGALDDKGMGVMNLMAHVLIARQNVRLKKDVVFLATADEETGGEYGAGYMVREHKDKLEADLLINEGGTQMEGILPGDAPLFMIGLGEKGPLWLELKREGASGHASVPVSENAPIKLSAAISRLSKRKRPIRMSGETLDFFYGLGEGIGGIKGALLKAVKIPLLRQIVGKIAAKNPSVRAMIADTTSVTMINAGVKENVIPGEAKATLDNRLLPGTDKDEFVGWIRKCLGDDKIMIREAMFSPPSKSRYDEKIFSAIKDVAKELHPKSVTVPMVYQAFTDSRYFRDIGIPSYGIVPASVTAEDIKGIHGVNEKISEEALLGGVKFLYNLILKLCT
jgi:acetylornithine deacetylase/succinyl-diaminopimelate desuccinylase-like protein